MAARKSEVRMLARSSAQAPSRNLGIGFEILNVAAAIPTATCTPSCSLHSYLNLENHIATTPSTVRHFVT